MARCNTGRTYSITQRLRIYTWVRIYLHMSSYLHMSCDTNAPLTNSNTSNIASPTYDLRTSYTCVTQRLTGNVSIIIRTENYCEVRWTALWLPHSPRTTGERSRRNMGCTRAGPTSNIHNRSMESKFDIGQIGVRASGYVRSSFLRASFSPPIPLNPEFFILVTDCSTHSPSVKMYAWVCTGELCEHFNSTDTKRGVFSFRLYYINMWLENICTIAKTKSPYLSKAHYNNLSE